MIMSIMSVNQRCIPNNGVGDWRPWGDGHDAEYMEIKVANELKDPRSRFGVALHELFEGFACTMRKIPEPAVAAWDAEHLGADEPGEVPGAPYFKEHADANALERLAVEALGLTWEEHCQNVEAACD